MHREVWVLIESRRGWKRALGTERCFSERVASGLNC